MEFSSPPTHVMPSSASPSPHPNDHDDHDLPPPSSRDVAPPPPPSRSLNRSSFDLEPNPFEQSFSNSRTDDAASENKSDYSDQPNNDTSPKPKPDTVTAKPVLPSLAALSSPSNGSYTWSDLAGSLRSGPLSPAMLQGPQQPQQQASRIPLPFDPAPSYPRTGLTPSTGLTPLVGGPVSFPPPSPNTAAFLAMVTSSSSAPQLPANQTTITPNTLTTISGMINPTQQQQQQPVIAPSATTTSAPGITATVPPQQQSLSPYSFNTAVHQANGSAAYAATSAATAANAAANGLFLLSQAHQELAKREEAQARAGAHPADPPAKRGSKRKSLDGPATAAAPAASSRASANKRTRPAPQRRRGKASTGSAEDDDSGDDDVVDESERQGSQTGPKKPETEEEKRRNFLERNRQAALKCRQRKKAWLAQLQAKVEFLSNENERLTTALVSSREEISRLNALLGGGNSGPASNGQSSVAAQPVSVSVSLPTASKNVTASAPVPPVSVVSNGRGYGY